MGEVVELRVEPGIVHPVAADGSHDQTIGSGREVVPTFFEPVVVDDVVRRRPVLARPRVVLADDPTFRGPLGTADDAETCIQGMQRMAQIMTDIVIHKTFVDGPDVPTWFDLHTRVAPPCRPPTGATPKTGRSRLFR